MNTYIVKLTVVIGEYEKTVTSIMEAETEREASILALESECHDEPENEINPSEFLLDAFDNFAYKVSSVHLIADKKEAEIVKKHFNHY